MGVNTDGAFLKNEGGLVKIERVENSELISDGDGGIGILGGMEVQMEEGCLIAEFLEGDLIALKVAVDLPGDSLLSRGTE